MSPSFSEKRSAPRYSFTVAVDIVEPASDTHIAGRITDISRRGCYVNTLNPLPKGTSIQLRISRGMGTFVLSGRIVYVQDGMGMGVRFVETPFHQQEVLDSWIAELSSSPAPPQIPGFAPKDAKAQAAPSLSAHSVYAAQKKSAPSSSPYVAQQTPQRKNGRRIAVILGSVVILAALFVWWSHLFSSPPKVASSSDAAVTTPAETTVEKPEPSENLPIGPGKIASIGELSKAWSSKRFLFGSPLTGEEVPAMVVHLPGGGYWGFFLREPSSGCDMELVTDLQKLQADYHFRADHPMLGDPCNRSVFDLTRYGPGSTGLVRGEVEQGAATGPPIAIEIQTRGNQVLAVRAE